MTSPAPTPVVLAGITTRNRAHILPKALDSLCALDWPGLEIALIDDASTDGTEQLRARYPRVKWTRRDQSAGYMINRNEFMRQAADYFLCLDDDAWFMRGDELALAVAHLEARPEVAAVAFDILSPDRAEPRPRGPARPVSLFIGCGHLLRLSAARAAGLYAPMPGAYGAEEKDLCLRLADLGFSVHLLPGVHVWHDKAWSGRDWFPLHRSGVCNELVMTIRRCPLPDVLLVLPLKLLSFVWYWIRRPRFLPSGLTGLWDAMRALSQTIATRRPVRRATFWQFSRQA